MTLHPRDHGHAATLFEQQLRMHVAHVDLANRGRYRSTYLLDEFFFELVGIAAPALFVEAGAFDAEASRRAAAGASRPRAVAFEANPSNFAAWRSKVDFEAAGVEYLNLALADQPGPITFHLSGDSDFEDNSILQAVTHAGSQGETVEVDATTLDDFFADAPGRAAIWIDVEGANQHVLEGGAEFLRRCDVLKVEVEDVPIWDGQWLAHDVIDALLGAGMVPVARDVQKPGQYNLVCVSASLARHPEVVVALEDFLRRQVKPELPGVIGKVRRSERVRHAVRAVRR